VHSSQWTSSSGFTGKQRFHPVDQPDAVDLDLVEPFDLEDQVFLRSRSQPPEALAEPARAT
jgi:hypothetical protein